MCMWCEGVRVTRRGVYDYVGIGVQIRRPANNKKQQQQQTAKSTTTLVSSRIRTTLSEAR